MRKPGRVWCPNWLRNNILKNCELRWKAMRIPKSRTQRGVFRAAVLGGRRLVAIGTREKTFPATWPNSYQHRHFKSFARTFFGAEVVEASSLRKFLSPSVQGQVEVKTARCLIMWAYVGI